MNTTVLTEAPGFLLDGADYSDCVSSRDTCLAKSCLSTQLLLVKKTRESSSDMWGSLWMLRIEHNVLCIPGKWCATDVHSQP